MDTTHSNDGSHNATSNTHPATHGGTPAGITVREYAERLQLSYGLVAELGLTDFYYSGKAAIKIPYFNKNRQEVGARFIVRSAGLPDGIAFVWKKNVKHVPYGLWRMDGNSTQKGVVLVSDEIDCHVLWAHGIPALAVTVPVVPNLPNLLANEPKIVILAGAEATDPIIEALLHGGFKDRVRLANLPGQHRPLVRMHLRNPTAFHADLKASIRLEEVVTQEQEPTESMGPSSRARSKSRKISAAVRREQYRLVMMDDRERRKEEHRLAQWCEAQRWEYVMERLSAHKIKKLEELPGWTWKNKAGQPLKRPEPTT